MRKRLGNSVRSLVESNRFSLDVQDQLFWITCRTVRIGGEWNTFYLRLKSRLDDLRLLFINKQRRELP